MKVCPKVKMKDKPALLIIFIFLGFAILSAIAIGSGLFLFSPETELPAKSFNTELPFPVVHRQESRIVSGNNQKINILEVDPADPRVEVEPVLSYDNVFGFELLSLIDQRSNSYATVNSGFYYPYGNPSGMVAIKGKLIHLSTGRFPVLHIQKGEATLKEVKAELTLKTRNTKILISKVNPFGVSQGTVLFTSEYGRDTKTQAESIAVSVDENQIITGIFRTEGKVPIPRGGMILAFLTPDKMSLSDIKLKIGDKVELEYSPELVGTYAAYECGSWILESGKIVIGKKDPWVGILTNRDPRTAVGIKRNGHIVFVTIDGRQPGHSAGLTGKELGNLLLQYDIVDAAMLDGGASTEMIVQGKIVNRISGGNRERPVGGGLVVRVRKDG